MRIGIKFNNGKIIIDYCDVVVCRGRNDNEEYYYMLGYEDINDVYIDKFINLRNGIMYSLDDGTNKKKNMDLATWWLEENKYDILRIIPGDELVLAAVEDLYD